MLLGLSQRLSCSPPSVLETKARIAKEEAETVKAALESAARIATEEAATAQTALETAARIAKDEAETTARIAKDAAESAAQIKANAARLRLEQSERKQALAAKNRLDNAAVDMKKAGYKLPRARRSGAPIRSQTPLTRTATLERPLHTCS